MLTRTSTIALVLCIFGLGLGLFTRHNGFEYYYHPDEYRKVRQLVKSERNFHHPMLMLTTVDLVRRATLRGSSKRDSQSVVLVGRWVTAAFAAAAAAALALLAARQYGLLAGWLAGVLVLSNSLLFELAHYLKEDPYFAAGIAFTALALHAFQRKPDAPRLRWLAAATAMAAAGKFVGIALLPMVLIAVWRRSAPPGYMEQRARIRRFLVVFALVWLVLNYWIFKTPAMMWSSIGEEMQKAYAGEAQRQGPHAFYLRVQEQNGGWLAPALAGLWLLWAMRHARRVPYAEWVLAGSSLLYFVVFSCTPKDSTRYYLPIAISLCYFAVAGVMVWARQFRWKGMTWAAAALVLITAGAQSRSLAEAWDGFTHDDREQLEDWVTANLPADAVIAQDEAVNLPEPGRLSKKHEGRAPLPQRVIGAPVLADLGDLAKLKSMGITHAAINHRTYSRYLNGSLDIQEGTPAAAIRQFYLTITDSGRIIWETPPGRNGHLQPGLRLIDIRAIPER
ncbi:MAG: hypothetical protein V4726_09945 [Verrucomicrobiota bacterium]